MPHGEDELEHEVEVLLRVDDRRVLLGDEAREHARRCAAGRSTPLAQPSRKSGMAEPMKPTA